MLVLVQEVDFARLVVDPADADVVALQHLAQLVADEVDDALEVQRAGHALLDAVDHRELGVALLGLLQQALRLVEQARVLQRDAHRRGDRLEQAHFGLAERMLALVILELQAAQHAIAGDDLHVDEGEALVGAFHRRVAGGDLLGRGVVDGGVRAASLCDSGQRHRAGCRAASRARTRRCC